MSEPIPPIRLTLTSPAAPALAWAYLTDPERVAEWFTEATPVGSVGDPYRLDFGEGSIVEGVVLDLDPGRRFAHSWAWADAEPREETTVSWLVEALETGGVRVVLEHAGWTEAGSDEAARDDHEAYWSGYLDDLEALLAEAAADG